MASSGLSIWPWTTFDRSTWHCGMDVFGINHHFGSLVNDYFEILLVLSQNANFDWNRDTWADISFVSMDLKVFLKIESWCTGDLAELTVPHREDWVEDESTRGLYMQEINEVVKNIFLQRICTMMGYTGSAEGKPLLDIWSKGWRHVISIIEAAIYNSASKQVVDLKWSTLIEVLALLIYVLVNPWTILVHNAGDHDLLTGSNACGWLPQNNWLINKELSWSVPEYLPWWIVDDICDVYLVLKL